MVILYSRWLHLSITTRHKIAEAFGIIKKGSTEVYSNTIKHDGYDVHDIEAILTIEAMQNFLQCQNDDVGFVFNLLVDKFEGRELIGLIPIETPKSGLLSQMTSLPPEEAKQFDKEYKARKKTLKTSIKKTKHGKSKN